MRGQKPIACITLACFVATHGTAAAPPHDEGVAAGRAAIPAARASITAPAASAVVPGYTTMPDERAHYRQPNLAAQAGARLVQCQLQPNDPVCQAQRTAIGSANTARPAITANDPSVAAAAALVRNPSLELGSLAGYYAGCEVTESNAPAGTVLRQCQRYEGVGNYTVRRDLNVQVDLVPNCEEGSWFKRVQANRNGADHMLAEVQCRLRHDGVQRFRFYAAGLRGACSGWPTADLPAAPLDAARIVAELSPHWSGGCWSDFKVVALPGSGCALGRCSYTFEFGTPMYACPAGTVSGRSLVGLWDGDFETQGPATSCYTVAAPDPEQGCAAGTTPVHDDTGTRCARPAAEAQLTGAEGWRLNLDYAKPDLDQVETDTWNDHRPALAAGGRCTPLSEEVCTEGPGDKIINGRRITRACWAHEQTLSCAGGLPLDECQPLIASGCVAQSSICKQTHPVTGRCEVHQDTVACPMPAEPVSRSSQCPRNVFCLGANCFNIASPDDPDFGRSMSMLEATREAGVYLDSDNLRVFNGEENRCRNRLLKNCCSSDSAGAGMTNQSVFGTGSRLVYDVLMNSENREFLYQGLSALITGAGYSGTFSAYGVTVAVNGAAIPVGSTVLYEGTSMVIAFDPWSLVIAVIIYVVLEMMSCNESEARLALKEGAKLCHSVGTWCSRCVRAHLVLCAGCEEHTTSKCCFNSMLARIVHEQGRAQVGRGWGEARNPDCSGFTVAQLQALNFGAMDLTEFYESLVPTLPNLPALQHRSANRLSTCYYGQGRCQ